MRTPGFSTLLVSTVAVLALAATGCRRSGPTPPPVCDKAQPGASCASNGDCCSGSCYVPSGGTAGMCLATPCGSVGAGCGAASDCCNASCDPAMHECAAEACTLGRPGASCAYPTDCCSGSCEGAIGSKVCTSFPACHPAGEACTGTTVADK